MWIGHSGAVTSYVASVLKDPTYLYECFDVATPSSFLYDFVKTTYRDADPHCLVFLGSGGRMLVREPNGYVERDVDEGMGLVVGVWYSQCERVCATLLRDFDYSFAGMSTVLHPLERPRLKAGDIARKLQTLRYQFANRVDIEVVHTLMHRTWTKRDGATAEERGEKRSRVIP